MCDLQDTNPGFAGECSDVDEDGCDDCASGFFDPSDDGLDVDEDGACEPCLSSLSCQDAGFVCVPDSVEGDVCLCWAPSLGCTCESNWVSSNPGAPTTEECVEGQYCDEVCLDLGSGLERIQDSAIKRSK